MLLAARDQHNLERQESVTGFAQTMSTIIIFIMQVVQEIKITNTNTTLRERGNEDK